MTNEEAKAFLDNLKICIDEHPIVADWLVEIAERKPNNSEIPNNCEDLQDWKDRMWAEAIVTEPTISKMEQVDKDINVRSKTEPTTQTKTQNSNLTFEKADEPQTDCKTCKHKDLEGCEEPCLECKGYDLYEPQTERNE